MPENLEISSNEEITLLDWNAFERPQKKWSKEFFSSIIVMAFLASIILYFIEGLMPVLAIWSLVFMIWAMSRTEPRTEKYAITSWGLKTTERTFRYETMTTFWFETKWGGRLMHINLAHMPWHIVIVIDPKKEDQIRKLMLNYVVFQLPAITVVDRLVKWLGEKIPLE